MTKILFFSDGLLFKNSGIEHVSKRNLNALIGIYGVDNVDVVALKGDSEAKDIQTSIDHFITFNPGLTKLSRLFNYLCLRYNLSARNIKQIISLIKCHGYSTVFVDNSMYGVLVKKIKKHNPNITIVTFFHDYKANLVISWLKNRGLFYLPQTLSILYNEYLTSIYADELICLTSRDSESIQKKYKRKAAVIPVTIVDLFDVNQSKLFENKNDNGIKILFVGANYFPNTKGIAWFISNVLPYIEGELYIVGKGLEMCSQFKNIDRVVLVGSVTIDELKTHYYNAECVVAPIFEGGGMKVKVAEALSYGKIIFGTDEAFVGYDIDYSQIGGCCNSASEFISAMNEWSSKHRYEKNWSKSREFFEKKYSNESAMSMFSKLLANK